MKILYQSYVNKAISGSYLHHLSDYLNQVKGSDTEIVIGEMEPADKYAHPFVEYACGFSAIQKVYEAEKAGFDAIILGHFQDSGLLEAKSIVDIPVIGLGEISLLHAYTLARKIGVITINPRFISIHQEQVARYGLDKRVIDIRAIDFQPGELTEAFENPVTMEKVIESFTHQAQAVVDAGAEIIIPAGGIPMLLTGRIPKMQVSGVPVLNAIPVVVKHAEMAIELARLNGYHISRIGPYLQPPADIIQEFISQD